MVRNVAKVFDLADATLTFETASARKKFKLRDIGVDGFNKLRYTDWYGFNVSATKDSEVEIGNSAAYISLVYAGGYSKLIVYSPVASIELFTERGRNEFTRETRGKYGFVVGWPKKASFWAYAAGFVDYESTGGDLLADTPAGYWGSDIRADPGVLDGGYFETSIP
jgi:hypothetical protein